MRRRGMGARERKETAEEGITQSLGDEDELFGP
jgi:hypothetical protein